MQSQVETVGKYNAVRGWMKIKLWDALESDSLIHAAGPFHKRSKKASFPIVPEH